MNKEELVLLWLCARYVEIDFLNPLNEKILSAIKNAMKKVENIVGTEDLFKIASILQDKLESKSTSNVILFKRRG